MGELPTLALFWGEDRFLLRQAAHELLERHRLRPTEVEAAEWRGGETSDLLTPSLWGERRALLVTGCEALPEHGSRELERYLESPSGEAVCVLTYRSAGRGHARLAKRIDAAGGVSRQVALRRQDLPRWVLERARARGLDLSAPGAAALVESVGEEPAALDQAVEQLATAFPKQPVGPEQVRDQFVGLGEQRVWDLCDQALAGRLPESLLALRSLLEAREEPLLILGVIASRLRDLIRVRGLPSRLAPAEATRLAGLRYEWQLRRYRQQAARFAPEHLEELHARVVEADRALKGGYPGDVVLASLVAQMAGDRSAALAVPRVGR